MVSRSEQKEETRQKVLQAAREHFERFGFEDANIRAIADTAGVAPGTVLLHFEDKPDLLHAALHEDLKTALRQSLRAGNRGKLDARLLSLFEPFFAYYERNPRLSKTLLKQSLFAEPPWQGRFTEQVESVHEHATLLLQKAQSREELSARVSPALFAASLFSFYYFALVSWAQGAVPDPRSLFLPLVRQQLALAAPRTAR